MALTQFQLQEQKARRQTLKWTLQGLSICLGVELRKNGLPLAKASTKIQKDGSVIMDTKAHGRLKIMYDPRKATYFLGPESTDIKDHAAIMSVLAKMDHPHRYHPDSPAVGDMVWAADLFPPEAPPIVAYVYGNATAKLYGVVVTQGPAVLHAEGGTCAMGQVSTGAAAALRWLKERGETKLEFRVADPKVLETARTSLLVQQSSSLKALRGSNYTVAAVGGPKDARFMEMAETFAKPADAPSTLPEIPHIPHDLAVRATIEAATSRIR